MSDLIFALGQTKKKKESDAKIKRTKARLKDVTITETVESNVRSYHHYEDQKYKETKRKLKKDLQDVTQEESIEMINRRYQAQRDKQWKEIGRNQIKRNSKFDLARSLFGGSVTQNRRCEVEKDTKPNLQIRQNPRFNVTRKFFGGNNHVQSIPYNNEKYSTQSDDQDEKNSKVDTARTSRSIFVESEPVSSSDCTEDDKWSLDGGGDQETSTSYDDEPYTPKVDYKAIKTLKLCSPASPLHPAGGYRRVDMASNLHGGALQDSSSDEEDSIEVEYYEEEITDSSGEYEEEVIIVIGEELEEYARSLE